MSVLINDEQIEILISESEIKARINHLAKEISDTYKKSDQLSSLGCYVVPLFLLLTW